MLSPPFPGQIWKPPVPSFCQVFTIGSECSLLTVPVYSVITQNILAHFTQQPVMPFAWNYERKFDLAAFLPSCRQSSPLRKAVPLHQHLSTALLQSPLAKPHGLLRRPKRSELRAYSLLGKKLAMEECLGSGKTTWKHVKSAKKYQCCGVILPEMTQLPL